MLDSCTSYGTQLFWPISTHRISWNSVSIIDPLFTIPLLIFVVWAAIKKQPNFAIIGLLWAITYQSVGIVQNYRATTVGWQLAEQRNHQPIRLSAKPTLGNLLLWKVMYETEDQFYSNGVRIGLKSKIYEGTSIEKLNIQRDFPWPNPHSQQAKDLQRFAWFSQDYVAVDPDNPNRIFDARYSLIPTDIKGLWSIWLDPNVNLSAHADYKHDRDVGNEKNEKSYLIC